MKEISNIAYYIDCGYLEKLSTWERDTETERKNGVNSGHYVLPATPKGSTQNSLRKK